jgi:AcrR family transcriptional regulator
MAVSLLRGPEPGLIAALGGGWGAMRIALTTRVSECILTHLMSPAATHRRLSTADVRREELLTAAARVYAQRGLHAPTTEIARAAGISQAYLFRLFPTKADLALALFERCNQRIHATFTAAAAQAKAAGEDVLPAMGQAYRDLLQDRELLLVQLHAHAASPQEPAIRDAMRRCFARLVEVVERESGASPAEVQAFFAHGMLLNVLAALDVPRVDGHWAEVLAGDCHEGT